jgi:hypothetical protein
VLAAFAADTAGDSIDTYLTDRVFAQTEFDSIDPDPEDVPGFAAYLSRYRTGLTIEHAAIAAMP